MANEVTLLQAFRRVRGALDTTSAMPEDAVVVFRDGFAHAENRHLAACSPLPASMKDLDFAVFSGEFAKALERLPEGRPTVKGDKVILQVGKTRVSLPMIDKPRLRARPEVETKAPPKRLAQALYAGNPFRSKEKARPWTMGARIDSRLMTVTNAIALASIDLGEDTDFDAVTISGPLYEFLYSRRDEVSAWGFDRECVLVEFEDGGWVRGARLEGEAPATVPALIEQRYQEPEGTVTDDWREQVLHFSDLWSDDVRVFSDRIESGAGSSTVVVEVATPSAGEAVFSPKEFGVVVRSASHVDFAAYPAPISFKGDNIKGLLAGRS